MKSVPCWRGKTSCHKRCDYGYSVWDITKCVPIRKSWDITKSVTGETIWIGIGVFHISHPPYRVIIENYYKKSTHPFESVSITGREVQISIISFNFV